MKLNSITVSPALPASNTSNHFKNQQTIKPPPGHTKKDTDDSPSKF